ncbi:PAS domain S-box protein [Aliiglaciecola sp. CAU 1673]|uniref:PAS domain S-box protein n=1 Tax=Aliiglaciecola sp. CAU 1673 TaxID=3032595 RepID=UPI0023DA18A8|nr:PAS domain S-box protein [Aliiglaciecola sp. CAU 1673]MDF2177797.1 PAS domain S-box protein [Aliiglaciecola sp. CAU 1673]
MKTVINRLTLMGWLAVAAVVILCLLVAFLSGRIERTKGIIEYDALLDSQIAVKSDALVDELEDLRRDISLLASVPPTIGIARAVDSGMDHADGSSLPQWLGRLEAIFAAYLEVHPKSSRVDYIALYDQPKLMLSLESENGKVINNPDRGLLNPRHMHIINGGADMAKGEVFISRPFLQRNSDGPLKPTRPMIWLSTPIYDDKGKIFGVVLLHYDASSLLAELKAKLPAGFLLYLTDQNGDFYIHPRLEKTFAFEWDQPWRWQDEFSPTTSDILPELNDRLYASGAEQIVVSEYLYPLSGGKLPRALYLRISFPKSLLDGRVQRTQYNVLLTMVLCLSLVGAFYYLYRKSSKSQHRAEKEMALRSAIVDSSQDAIIGEDLEGNITQWNHGAEEMFGYSAEQALGQNLAQLLVPSEYQAQYQEVRSGLANGQSLPHYVTKRRRVDGQLLDVSISVAPLRDADGKHIGSAKTIRDISEQIQVQHRIEDLNENLEKQVQERTDQLSQSLSILQAITGQAGSAIVATDTQGIITFFNPAAEQMLGYRASDIIGVETPALFHLQDEVAERAIEFSQEIGKRVKPGFETFIVKSKLGMPNAHEWTYVCKDGSLIPVYLQVTALRNDNKDIVGYMGMASDITEQKKGRDKLVAMRDQMLKAADLAGLGVWTWDVKTGKLNWNRQMFTIYQLPAELGKQGLNIDHWRNCLHPDDLTETSKRLESAMDGLDVFNLVFRILRPNGEVRYVQAGAMVERDAEGVPEQVLGINQDVTEQREYEKRLQEAKQYADQANQAKSLFLANMSHEIRTPMNAVLGMLQLLGQTDMAMQQHDYVKKAEAAARALLGILNDILDFSKVEAGKLVLDPQPCEIERIVRDVGDIISVNLGDRNIEVLFDVEPGIPQRIRLDGMRLQQILINLCGNAIKFTHEGEVMLSVKVAEREEQHLILEFTVSDTGIGISEEHLQRIFDGFNQAEASTARRYGGTGLGLVICKRLISLMGGQMRVKSEVGKGSEFSFTLPCIEEQAETDNLYSLPKNLRVLVVDDHRGARDILASLCTSFGWKVEKLESGEQAVARLRSQVQPVDLVLMDWNMPGLDGWRASKMIRQSHGMETMPMIILVTGTSREKLNREQSNSPHLINGFLVKPVTASTLFDAVADALLLKDKKPPQPASKLARLDGVSILLVEDNLTNQQVAGELLRMEGAEVSVAENGAVAVEMLRTAKPQFDLVLMDIQMPVLDGYGATREIRTNLGLTDLPIVAMTANAMVSDREAAFAVGMNDHIGKPFELAHLISVIRKHVFADAEQKAPEPIKSEASPPTAIQPTQTQGTEPLLDYRDAMLRFGGSEQVFQRATQSFLRDAPPLMLSLPSSWVPELVPQAVAALHSLKGMSATLGAKAVAVLCADLEHDVRTGIEPLSYASRVERLGQTLQLTYVEIQGRLEKPTAVQNKPEETNYFQPQELDVLAGLLEQSNLEALNQFERLKESLSAEHPKLAVALSDAITRMDFQNALLQIREFKQETQ